MNQYKSAPGEALELMLCSHYRFPRSYPFLGSRDLESKVISIMTILTWCDHDIRISDYRK